MPPITISMNSFPSILIEAEAGAVGAPMAVLADEKASGGKYVVASEAPGHKEVDKNQAGKITIQAPVKSAGDYYVWARVNWCCSCGNELALFINGTEAGVFTDATYKTWHWVRLSPADGRKKPKQTLAAGVAR